MNDNSAFHKWGIPGWALVASFTVFILFDAFSANNNEMFDFLSGIFSKDSIWQAILFGILVTGSGIPIGYIIWQIYFYIRWNSPVSGPGIWPPYLEGRDAEFRKGIKGINFPSVPIAPLLKLDLKEYKSIGKFVATIIYDVIHDVSPDPEPALRRHSYLLNTFHSLGASFLGVSVGYGFYILLKWRLEQSELVWGVYALLFSIANLAFMSVEHQHGIVLVEGLKIKLKHTAEIILGGLIFLFLTTNPVIHKSINHYLVVGVCLLFVIVWAASAKEVRRFLGIFSALLLLIQHYLNKEFAVFLEQQIDWQIVLSIILFQMLMIAFMRNRQGVYEQFSALENYYMYKYFNANERQKTSPKLSDPAPRPRSSPRRRSTPSA